jgi:membrane associated rhomboid family serine protease
VNRVIHTQEESSKSWSISIFVAVLFTAAIWLVYYINFDQHHMALNQYGVHPRELSGLTGIFTMVFLHGDFSHLFNNSISLIVLLWALVFFYRRLAFQVITFIILFGGFWLWLFAGQGSNHIGASGLIYGLAAFLFVSGVLRRQQQLMAVSILILFLHGAMVWGIFPQPDIPFGPKISWEGHLFGAIAGLGLALNYRKKSVQEEVVYDWEIEEAMEEKMDNCFREVSVAQLEQQWLQRFFIFDQSSYPNVSYKYVPRTGGPEELS